MKIYIEITHLDGLDAHGFIAITSSITGESEVLIPISMPLQSYEQALDNNLLTTLAGEATKTTLFLREGDNNRSEEIMP